jgi:hypothetical protein
MLFGHIIHAVYDPRGSEVPVNPSVLHSDTV